MHPSDFSKTQKAIETKNKSGIKSPLVPIARAVSGRKDIATNAGIPASQQNEMVSAFEHAEDHKPILNF